MEKWDVWDLKIKFESEILQRKRPARNLTLRICSVAIPEHLLRCMIFKSLYLKPGLVIPSFAENRTEFRNYFLSQEILMMNLK